MKIDLTYGGKLTTLINVKEKKKLDIRYTIDGKTGKSTTTSILTKTGYTTEKEIENVRRR